MGFDGSFLCGVSCFAVRPSGPKRQFDFILNRRDAKDGQNGTSILDYSERVHALKQRHLAYVQHQSSTDYSTLCVRAHHIPRSRLSLPKLPRRLQKEKDSIGDVISAEPSDAGASIAESTHHNIQMKRNDTDVVHTVADTQYAVGVSSSHPPRPTKLFGLSEYPSVKSLSQRLLREETDVSVTIATSGDVLHTSETNENKNNDNGILIPMLQGTCIARSAQVKGGLDPGIDGGTADTSSTDATCILDRNRKLREEAATRLLRAAVENLQRLENRPQNDASRVLATLKAQRRAMGHRRPGTLEVIPEADRTSLAVKKVHSKDELLPCVKKVDSKIEMVPCPNKEYYSKHEPVPCVDQVESKDDLVVCMDTESDEVDTNAYTSFGSRGIVHSDNSKHKSRSSYSYDQSSRTSSRYSFARPKHDTSPFVSSDLFKMNRLQMHANRKFNQRNIRYNH